MSLAQNTALFALLGTTYGGNGTTNFGLPNLQGRIPLHYGNGFTQGETSGEAAHTLIQTEMPQHIHPVIASSASAAAVSPAGNTWANGNVPAYTDPGGLAMHPAAVSNVGGSQPHDNMPPYLVVNFCICLSGIFPPRQ